MISLGHKVRKLLAAGVVAGAALLAPAQAAITVESKVDRATIYIGDRIVYTVAVKRTADVVVEMPSLGANLGMFEIRDYAVQEPSKQGDLITEQTEYVISTFETGDFEIPPLTIRYYTSADTTRRELCTEPIKITVLSLNPDQAGDIRDIKPPLEIPRDWRRLLRHVGIGALALLLLAAAVLAFIRYRKGKGLLPRREKPPRPAHEVALEELDALVGSGLLERGETKQFYSALSEIVRRYIEGRFYVAALEMTTGEVLQAMAEAAVGSAERELLRELLELSDLVKFAKYLPSVQENERAVQLAYDFVQRTKLVVAEVAAEAEAMANQEVELVGAAAGPEAEAQRDQEGG
ncbi:MAG: BatD family protein [bacterium]|jgi:hypothetical protein|nr:BatD family protein [candidate division KSB1 bacterium]MDH7561091.1 BatD family protein [bacterium]